MKMKIKKTNEHWAQLKKDIGRLSKLTGVSDVRLIEIAVLLLTEKINKELGKFIEENDNAK